MRTHAGLSSVLAAVLAASVHAADRAHVGHVSTGVLVLPGRGGGMAVLVHGLPEGFGELVVQQGARLTPLSEPELAAAGLSLGEILDRLAPFRLGSGDPDWIREVRLTGGLPAAAGAEVRGALQALLTALEAKVRQAPRVSHGRHRLTYGFISPGLRGAVEVLVHSTRGDSHGEYLFSRGDRTYVATRDSLKGEVDVGFLVTTLSGAQIVLDRALEAERTGIADPYGYTVAGVYAHDSLKVLEAFLDRMEAERVAGPALAARLAPLLAPPVYR
ncbi:MAG: hypothetical protein HY553_09345 [Elusimicrobia bacterium]|nr:hypothetical protein [Elusimicrobiota bacterium]